MAEVEYVYERPKEDLPKQKKSHKKLIIAVIAIAVILVAAYLLYTYSPLAAYIQAVTNFNDLTDIVMFGSIGYASRLIGKIEKTTDFGNSWIEQSTAPANFVTDIEFINENTGWLLVGTE